MSAFTEKQDLERSDMKGADVYARPTDDSATPSSPTESLAYRGLETRNDRVDMGRMGKEQVFKRNFGFWATFGFGSLYLATWEYLLVSVYSGLLNGGFGGLVWEYVATTLCYLTVVLSLAEMASMAPTSGGQYHWVSEFAPPSLQRHLSYAAGWTCATGWLTGAASGYFIMSTLVGALVEIYLPNLTFTNWQATLIMIGFVIITVLFNTFLMELLPLIEKVSLFGHISGWLITVVALWVMVPNKNSAHDVFLVVVDSGGWGNTGLSCLVGTVSVLFAQLGPDASVHIAEEVQDAALTLPRVMVWGYLYNSVLGFIMLITFLFCLGDLQTALNGDAPFQTAFINTDSKAMGTVLTVILALLIGSGNITAVTTTARETWAFARDGGLPFSPWMAKVSKRYNSPLNAVWVTTGLSFILCLINIGSTVAFNIIISLNLLAFLVTYIMSIGCILVKRLRGEPLPPARWSLGRWGVPLNIFAICYSVFALVMSSFPIGLPVDAASANWGPAIFFAVLVIALVSYLVQGHRIYQGPVVYVEGRRTEDTKFQGV